MTVHGSPEHFGQVTQAHVVGPWGACRCGANVGTTVAAYRAHIATVWRPFDLPSTF
jgi:hypothetical protein